jgi:predicted ArsR family transcriptional regulator
VRGDVNEAIARLCVLDDPARRAAYLAVRTADRPLTRAEVAAETGISARLAAFHLEKLCSEGLVEATYASERESAAVGHPAKRYKPTSAELELSIPPRRYDLAAEILAAAFDDAAGSKEDTLVDVATEYGRAVGPQAAAADTGDGRLLAALRLLGYEPVVTGDGEVVLRNCPFSVVAKARAEVICAMNLAFVTGVLDGTETRSLHASLSPSPERCCVVVAP